MQILEQYDVLNREEILMSLFMERGPKFLCKYLGLESVHSAEWKIVFDYLVLDKNVLFALAKRYNDHFCDLYEANGPAKMREILGVKLRKYDFIWQPIHDMVGIAQGALVKFVFNARFSLSDEMKVYGAEKLRERLQIDHTRYNETWERVLDVLLQHQVQSYVSATNSERLMSIFISQMNLRRPHAKL